MKTCSLFIALIAASADGSVAAEKILPIDIGSRRELFVDDLLIGKLDGTNLKLHKPHRLRRMPRRPFGHYATVLQDAGKLRLYYRGDKVPGAHWRNGWGKYHEGEVTLYAESNDGGINWTEPKLGLHKVPKIPRGNVVVDMSDDTFLVTHNFTPFIDTRPGVPATERYKALGGGRYPPENWGGGLPGGKLPPNVRFFTAQGKPEHWPMRYTIAHWATLLKGMAPGKYNVYCRTIDKRGNAQPMPRPFRKSGRNTIEKSPITIEA